MKRTIIIIIAILTTASYTAEAKKMLDNTNLPLYEYRLKAGFNIGGTSPLPLPKEIRDILGYSPSLSLSLGADVVRHINKKWAVMSGLTLETKGMTARARVKNYYIEMVISDGDVSGDVKGVFTGKVKTRAKNDYLTLPLAVVYKISPRWELNTGFFVSLLLNGGFDGEAFDGTIREGDPTGEMIGVTNATYNFENDIRKINWGGQFGARFRAYRQFSVYGDLSWAANSIFKKDFNSISFDMYNVYLNVGFAYTF